MNNESLERIKEILNDIIEVIETIEKRTVEKPSDNYNITPIKKQIMDIKYQVRRI